MENLYTKKQVHKAIIDEYKKEFGNLNDDNERNGYFIIGFVSSALDNSLPINDPTKTKLPAGAPIDTIKIDLDK